MLRFLRTLTTSYQLKKIRTGIPMICYPNLVVPTLHANLDWFKITKPQIQCFSVEQRWKSLSGRMKISPSTYQNAKEITQYSTSPLIKKVQQSSYHNETNQLKPFELIKLDQSVKPMRANCVCMYQH